MNGLPSDVKQKRVAGSLISRYIIYYIATESQMNNHFGKG